MAEKVPEWVDELSGFIKLQSVDQLQKIYDQIKSKPKTLADALERKSRFKNGCFHI